MAHFFKSVLLLLSLLVGSLIVRSKIRRRRRNEKAAALGCQSPPLLRSNNLLGNSILRDSMKASKEDRGPQYVKQQMDRIGCNTLVCPILDYEILVTRDPENARVLFTSPDFDISDTRQASWMPLLGKGIFTSRGEVWKHSRALLRPQFARDLIGDAAREEQHLLDLMNQLPADPSTGWTETIDIAPLFFKFTLDTATEFIFGQSTNVLSKAQGGQAADNTIDHHFNEAKVWIDKRGALAKFYWLLNSKEFEGHCSTVHKFADSIVADRLANPPEKHSSDPEAGVRFNLLNELAKETQNPRELRNETLHVLIAGRDTTGCLLGWVFYFLARHPAVYKKLRSIILDEFGTRQPEFRSLDRCNYMQWIISESLRVATVIPMNERRALRDTILPCGGGPDGTAPVFVPEGTQVLIPLYSMQHRADIWGNDVEEFRPERWETHKPGWEFIPFGAGARKCLGRKSISSHTPRLSF